MARKMPVGDQMVKLIVGAGQASPSPPVGPALGSKGVKSMDFCKVRPLCIGTAHLWLTAGRSSMQEQPISLLEPQSQLVSLSDQIDHSISSFAHQQPRGCYSRLQV